MLPVDVRIADVAKVIGILAGLPADKEPLGGGSYCCRVHGVEVKPSGMAEVATITINGDLVDGEKQHYSTWHWEPEDEGRLLYPKANPFWIAVGLKLVDFFGGTIVYTDTDGRKPNHRAKKPRQSNNPQDGKPWQDFQDAILAVKPLTKAELRAADKLSAYHNP